MAMNLKLGPQLQSYYKLREGQSARGAGGGGGGGGGRGVQEAKPSTGAAVLPFSRPCSTRASASINTIIINNSIRRTQKSTRHPRIPLQWSDSTSISNSTISGSSYSLFFTRKMSNLLLRHVEGVVTVAAPPHAKGVTLGEPLSSDGALDPHHLSLVVPSHQFSQNALIPSPDKYLEMYKRSIEDPAGFWSDIASQFFWKQPWNASSVFSENVDVRNGPVHIQWFKGGSTNISYNCLDRIVESGYGDKIALFWEANDPGVGATSLTYNQLLSRVCQLANYLKHIGVKKADAVVVYLPMLMELPITMLACARIGAVHSVVFAGFSAESLAQRIVDCKPKVVITCNAVKRGSKTIHLKDIVDGALLQSAQNGVSIDTCLVYANETAMKRETTKWQEGRDIWWQDVVPKYPTHCEVEWVDAEDPLFLLYTSGRTGKPKGVLHTTGGYMM